MSLKFEEITFLYEMVNYNVLPKSFVQGELCTLNLSVYLSVYIYIHHLPQTSSTARWGSLSYTRKVLRINCSNLNSSVLNTILFFTVISFVNLPILLFIGSKWNITWYYKCEKHGQLQYRESGRKDLKKTWKRSPATSIN